MRTPLTLQLPSEQSLTSTKRYNYFHNITKSNNQHQKHLHRKKAPASKNKDYIPPCKFTIFSHIYSPRPLFLSQPYLPKQVTQHRIFPRRHRRRRASPSLRDNISLFPPRDIESHRAPTCTSESQASKEFTLDLDSVRLSLPFILFSSSPLLAPRLLFRFSPSLSKRRRRRRRKRRRHRRRKIHPHPRQNFLTLLLRLRTKKSVGTAPPSRRPHSSESSARVNRRRNEA